MNYGLMWVYGKGSDNFNPTYRWSETSLSVLFSKNSRITGINKHSHSGYSNTIMCCSHLKSTFSVHSMTFLNFSY